MSDELESRIALTREEFGGLLDDDTLRRIALDQRGIKMSTEKKIGEFKDHEEVSAIVTVSKINDTKTFVRKRDNSQGKVRNLTIEDETGSCRLALWDDDVNIVENLGIIVGSKLKLTDCYCKQSEFGIDVSKGKKGQIEKI